MKVFMCSFLYSFTTLRINFSLRIDDAGSSLEAERHPEKVSFHIFNSLINSNFNIFKKLVTMIASYIIMLLNKFFCVTPVELQKVSIITLDLVVILCRKNE